MASSDWWIAWGRVDNAIGNFCIRGLGSRTSENNYGSWSGGGAYSFLRSFQKCLLDLPSLLRSSVWQQVELPDSVFAPDLAANADYLNRLMVLNIKFKGLVWERFNVNNQADEIKNIWSNADYQLTLS
jgi:hypothetical protein